MNKYVFPGADASCALNWVINRLESAGFEVKSVDVLGVHCPFLPWRAECPTRADVNMP